MGGVVDYCKENLPLFIPLLVLSIIFIAFLILLFCKQFKKSIVASATRSLYNATSPNVINQSNSNRSSIKRLRQVSEGSDHGFEFITTCSSPSRCNGRNPLTPVRSSRSSSTSRVNDSTGVFRGQFDSYPDSCESPNSPDYEKGKRARNSLPFSNEVEARMSHKRRTRSHLSSIRRPSSYPKTRKYSQADMIQEAMEPRLIHFQADYSGNYPQCLLDSMLPAAYSADTVSAPNELNAFPQEEFTPYYAAKLPRRGEQEPCVVLRRGGVIGGSLRENLAQQNEFRLTPVLEEMGTGSNPGTNKSLDNIVAQENSQAYVDRAAWLNFHQQNGRGCKTKHPVIFHRADYSQFNRYSTPLPYNSRPPLQMYRNISKTSSGMVSAATNQSSRTYYTNHNDLAQSISSISLSSTLDCYPPDESHERDIANVAPANLGVYVRNLSHSRPYSSDSELDAPLPGSRNSMSRAFNYNPIAVPVCPSVRSSNQGMRPSKQGTAPVDSLGNQVMSVPGSGSMERNLSTFQPNRIENIAPQLTSVPLPNQCDMLNASVFIADTNEYIETAAASSNSNVLNCQMRETQSADDNASTGRLQSEDDHQWV